MKSGLEQDWETPEGYRCVVSLNIKTGHRCGYIFIPAIDKAYVEPEYKELSVGKRTISILNYNDYDIEVHGGITYGEVVSPGQVYPGVESRAGTWIGFDAAHCDDRTDFDAWKALAQTDKDNHLVDTIFDIEKQVWGNGSTEDHREVRTKEFMIKECEDMSRQVYIMTKGQLENQDG